MKISRSIFNMQFIIAATVSLLVVPVIGPFAGCKSLAHNLHMLMKIFEYVCFQIFNTEGARNFGLFSFRIYIYAYNSLNFLKKKKRVKNNNKVEIRGKIY